MPTDHDSKEEPRTLTVDVAQERILAVVGPLHTVMVGIEDALGLMTAEPLAVKGHMPPFDNSAMDGFAVRAEDTQAAPVALPVRGDIAAGHPAGSELQAGTAMRIMTGAPIPTGADAVIRVEHTAPLEHERIEVSRSCSSGENIRRAGEDAQQGTVLLDTGTRITPGVIGLLAGMGHAMVPAYRRPRVGLLVTGDEVTDPGEPLAPGRIWNSNGPLLAGIIRQAGGEVVSLGVAGDADVQIRDRLDASEGLDLLVTTGGVSVGDFDVVKRVLQDEGRIELWNLRIKPGKPLAFGTLGAVPVIGLPGNPVAAAVAAWQFVHPAIRAMLGYRDVRLPEIEARVERSMRNPGGRRQFARVVVSRDTDGYTARLAGGQGSATLTSLATANGLLVIPESHTDVHQGDTLTVQILDDSRQF